MTMWTKTTLRVPCGYIGGPERFVGVEADVYGQLAVHPMIGSPGWAIALAATGKRISFGGRVFIERAPAIAIVQEIEPKAADWSLFFSDDDNTDRNALEAVRIFRDAHRAAHKAGAFIENLRVWPR
jgi:hypothetical protein